MVQVSKYKEKPELFYIDKIFQKIQVIWWKLHNQPVSARFWYQLWSKNFRQDENDQYHICQNSQHNGHSSDTKEVSSQHWYHSGDIPHILKKGLFNSLQDWLYYYMDFCMEEGTFYLPFTFHITNIKVNAIFILRQRVRSNAPTS